MSIFINIIKSCNRTGAELAVKGEDNTEVFPGQKKWGIKALAFKLVHLRISCVLRLFHV